MNYAPSDYVIKLLNLSDQLSNLGKTIFEFLQDDDFYVYRVVYNNEGTDRRCGFIDYSSIDFSIIDADNPSNEDYVTFGVFSAENQLRDFGNSLLLKQSGYRDSISGRDTFDEFIQKICRTLNVELLDEVHINSLVYAALDEYPTLGRFLPGISNNNINDNVWNLWEIFVGLLKAIGVMFKLQWISLDADKYTKLTLRLFFRSAGSTYTGTLDVIKETQTVRYEKKFYYAMVLAELSINNEDVSLIVFSVGVTTDIKGFIQRGDNWMQYGFGFLGLVS